MIPGTGRLGNTRTGRDHPDDRIIKIGKNTEKKEFWRFKENS